MTGDAGGGGGGRVPVSSAGSGGQFLLQLLQNPHQSHPETQSRPRINGAAAAPQPHHDPAVAAMGPTVHLHNQPWPQTVNPLYASTSFLPGFHSSPWAPQGSSLAANQIFFSDEFQQLGINGKPDGWKQQPEQEQRQKQQENMLMFGSLACEIGSPEELQNRNLLDKAMQFNVQKVLEVVEVNGRVDGLETRSNSGVEIGSNSGQNREFDRGMSSRSPHQWSRHGRHEPRRSTVAEPRMVPPGFPQRPKGPDQWAPMSRRSDLERNVGKEWRARDKLNHQQTYTSDDKVEILKRQVPKFDGVEENESSRLGLVKQLDQPGPPMGSDLHSVPASDIEESLASAHGRVEGSGRNGLTREESRNGDRGGGSVYEAHNHLEREDFPEHFADSLVLRDEVGRRRSDSFNQDSRSNRSREPQATGQWRKNYRRPVRCRMDIEKWTAPFLAIYDSLVPAEEEKAKQKQLLALLEKLVSKEWPRAQLYLYGSCANSFGVSNSDIDVCLAIDDADIDKSEHLLRLADILQSDNLQNVQALTRARVPIVKLMDPATGISSDICINNVLAVVNTKLLRDYGQIDGRLRQLAYIVKHWAKSRGVNKTYQGTLSSYAYVIMCIYFLQQRKPAILPCLQEMQATYVVKVDDIDCAYFDQVDLLQDFGSQNKESIAQLVWAFFDYWAYRHDYTNDVISVRTGRKISKREKDWTRRIGRDRHLICIEDPFETSHDLGRVVDKYSIRVLREEFERAANLLQYDPNPCVTLFDPYVPT